MLQGPRITPATRAVLRALLSDPVGRHYGLELSRAAELPSGTIYPMLARLERYGWIKGKWESVDPSREGRPRRKYYALTGKGARSARDILGTQSIDRQRYSRGAEDPKWA